MKLLIHDLPPDRMGRSDREGEKLYTISPGTNVHPCVGCFGCWVRTPGACVLRDDLGDVGRLLAQCSRVSILSRCCYGGFSPFVKNVLDRSIPYLHPDFVFKNNEMHHKRRYPNRIALSAWFYGPGLTDQVRRTARDLICANAVNLDCGVEGVRFSEKLEPWEDLT